MVKRVMRWAISRNQDGTHNVLRNGRIVQYSLSESQAQRYIQEKTKPGDRLFEQEEDGYLVPLVLSRSRQRRAKR